MQSHDSARVNTIVMANHPKRGRGYIGHVPSKEEIKEARGDMLQADAAALVYVSQVRWSDYETGKNRMHPAVWELFLIKRNLQDERK